MSQQQPSRSAALENLNDTDLILADAGQDIRNRKVIDRHGGAIGHVSDLFIDRDERKVRMLEIRAGGFLGLGDRHFLLPVDVITNVAKDEVRVNETRERIENSPSYDPKLLAAQAPEHWEPCYGYYGLSPFWGAGYVYPEFPKSAERPVTD